MAEKIEIETVLKANPKIDAEKLRESIRLSEALHKSGFVFRGYELPPPFARRRAEVIEDLCDDPRLVRLRHT